MQYLTQEFIFHYFLIFARFASILWTLPGFSDDRVLDRARLGIALFTSLALYPLLMPLLPIFNSQISMIAYYIASETLVGLMLGICARIYYTSLLVLGNLISMESGLSAATIFDPNQREQIMLFSSFLITLSLVMIFGSDTHHIFITGFLESYEKFKPGFMLDAGDVADHVSLIVSDSFLLAFKISAPFLIVGLAILVGSGVLSRLMPTLQVLFVITPIQILIMFGVLFVVVNSIISLVLERVISVF